MQSFALGFSQVCYDAVHTRHQRGNSDRKGDDGHTIDWASIYRHGHDDEAESVWSYTFFSYIRDDPFAILKELGQKEKGSYLGRNRDHRLSDFLCRHVL